MKLLSITTLVAGAALTLASCHTGKNAYVKKFHKDLKHDVSGAKIKWKADTVRVIYPELAMFDFGKDEIKATAKPSLKNFATVLSRYDRIDAKINGYTDNVGTDEVNNDLSKRRAENAKQLFEQNGVGTSRIMTSGMGKADPLESNTTDEGRQANRRVEVLLYERK
ncbi:MAG: OmpA family protein [Sphingobacteriales bacterium]|nr:MAG: OmpA family protein [Sphingobacteriales bacterium]